MRARVTVITLGVDDLDAALRFYRDGLGFATEGIVGREFEHGAVVFIDLQPGLRLALWPRASLAHGTGLAVGPRSATELSLGHNVGSRAEVAGLVLTAEKMSGRRHRVASVIVERLAEPGEQEEAS